MNGPAAGALPDDRGLALIGDAERGDALHAHGAAREDLTHARERVAPDILGVVLHPAGGRVVLLVLAPCNGHRTRPWIEGDGAGRGRALVDGENVLGGTHGCGVLGKRLAGAQRRPGR